MIANIGKVRNRLFLLFLIMTGFSCQNKREPKQFYYCRTDKYDSTSSRYLIQRISFDEKYRYITTLMYNPSEDSFELVEKAKFIQDNKGLLIVTRKNDKRVVAPYMTSAHKDCVHFRYGIQMDDIIARSFCFLGKENIKVGNKKYDNAYKFRKGIGLNFRIDAIAYYDEDWVLIKEECVAEYDGYTITRLDSLTGRARIKAQSIDWLGR